MHRVFHGAQLHARDVFGCLNGVAVVGDVAETLFAPSQGHHARAVELGQDVLTDRPVKHAARVVEAAEQEGDVGHAGGGNEVAQRAGGDDGRLDGAQLQAFDDLALTTQTGGGEMAEAELAVGLGLDDLLPLLRRDAVVAVGGESVADLDFGLGAQGSSGERGQSGENCRGLDDFEHFVSSSDLINKVTKTASGGCSEWQWGWGALWTMNPQQSAAKFP